MYEKHNAVIVEFEEKNLFVYAGFSGPEIPVGEEEEEEEGCG